MNTKDKQTKCCIPCFSSTGKRRWCWSFAPQWFSSNPKNISGASGSHSCWMKSAELPRSSQDSLSLVQLSDSIYNDRTLHLLLSIWQLLLESCRTRHLLKQQKYIKLIHYILSHPFLLELEENLLWFSASCRTWPWMQNVALWCLTEIM